MDQTTIEVELDNGQLLFTYTAKHVPAIGDKIHYVTPPPECTAKYVKIVGVLWMMNEYRNNLSKVILTVVPCRS